jgi:hypothetical protein
MRIHPFGVLTHPETEMIVHGPFTGHYGRSNSVTLNPSAYAMKINVQGGIYFMHN